MGTRTEKVGVYRHVKYGAEVIGVVSRLQNDPEYILISNTVIVEFQIIDASTEKDALKALKIKAVQDRIEVAQAELDALL